MTAGFKGVRWSTEVKNHCRNAILSCWEQASCEYRRVKVAKYLALNFLDWIFYIHKFTLHYLGPTPSGFRYPCCSAFIINSMSYLFPFISFYCRLSFSHFERLFNLHDVSRWSQILHYLPLSCDYPVCVKTTMLLLQFVGLSVCLSVIVKNLLANFHDMFGESIGQF